MPWVPYTLTIIPPFINDIIGHKKSAVSTVVGAFLYALLLGAISQWRDDIATALAWLVAITGMAINGPQLFNLIGKVA